MATSVSFPHPPRVTGDVKVDVPAIIFWLWQFYKAAVPEGGFVPAGVPIQLASYSVSGLPDAAENVRCLIWVEDEASGAVPAYSDGVNWRRVNDRVIVS